MTTRIYRLSADPVLVDAAGNAPRQESRRLVHVEWDIPEAEFPDVPVLRRWLHDHGIDDIGERGITVWGEPLPPRREPYWCSEMPGWLSWRGGQGDLTRSQPCRACNLPVTSVQPSADVDADSVSLLTGKLEQIPLCYLSTGCVAARPDLVAGLRTEGLGEGLATRPLDLQGNALLIWPEASLGGPAYPFGPEPCEVCGRASRRVDGKLRFVRPNYAFDLTFDCKPRQWSWSTVYGQGMPLVSSEVAAYLLAAMPALSFLPHGRPDDKWAFLPQLYR
ncbi:hypothetical protein [Streptomyces sp. NPDC056672]|uniref:hypothetical protein n=1 Tax=Streptomyces sp. NPDC056672 TaxID=3345906 RepID=UPI0036887122